MRLDLTGQHFGRLTAIRYVYTDERRRACWLFRCDCGNEKIIQAVDVKRGNTQSCGCLARENSSRRSQIDITGKRFGRLTAVRSTSERDASASVVWECRCDCGKTVRYSAAGLNQNRILSCGCLYRESRTKCPSYRRDVCDGTSLSSLAASKKLRDDNTSGCTGVSWDQTQNTWHAYINFQKKRYNLGTFKEKAQAINARKQAERKLHDPVLAQRLELLTKESKHKFLEYLQKEQSTKNRIKSQRFFLSWTEQNYMVRSINGVHLFIPLGQNRSGSLYILSMNDAGFLQWQERGLLPEQMR